MEDAGCGPKRDAGHPRRHGAIVLAGGFSRRMGRDKASLPFGPETLLERSVRIVSSVADEVIVAAREGQQIPGAFAVARDAAEGLGPLAGIVAGLEALDAGHAFVTGCDAPFLLPGLVLYLLDLADEHDLVIPEIGGRPMNTAAVYSRSLLPVARSLVEQGRLRLGLLVEAASRPRVVAESEVRTIDPDLRSFRTCNTPEEYIAALRDAGFAA